MNGSGDSLFFIRRIADAYRQPNPGKALKSALSDIVAHGRTLHGEESIWQFNRFMREVQLAAGVEVVIERDGRGLCHGLVAPGRPLSLEDVRPGEYCVRLSTGRVIWSAELSAGHLAWPQVEQGLDLRLAAATNDGATVPTLCEGTLGGELVVFVFPGRQLGELKVEMP